MARTRKTRKIGGEIFEHYWPILILAVVLFLRLPSLFEPFTYGDEGIYVTLGQAAKKGWVWYRDIHDNKPPLLYLLAVIAGNFEYFRLILFFWSLATIFLFHRLARVLFGKNKWATIFSTCLFALLTSLHNFEGNVAGAENFMMLPTIGGILLILKGLDKHRYGYLMFFSAGILFSLAALFKVPAAFDFIAALVFILLIFLAQKKKNYSLFIIRYSLFVFGFLLPILATFLYYVHRNALYQYLTATFFQNIPYLSSWSSGQRQAGSLPLPLIGRGLTVFSLIVILALSRKKISLAAKLILTWFAFSWFAALLSSRPYPHYWIQVLPPLCLSSGLIFYQKIKNIGEKTIPFILSMILALSFIFFNFWWYENTSYYLNFYQYALGIKTRRQYFLEFDPQTERIYQTADYLKNRTLPGEKIFIWGNDPFIYALTQRLPVGRYTAAYHIVDFNGYQETIGTLTQNQPRYLLVTGTENRPFPELTAFIQAHYLLENRIQNTKIFHRRLLMANF